MSLSFDNTICYQKLGEIRIEKKQEYDKLINIRNHMNYLLLDKYHRKTKERIDK
jgi:hypothetical protein